MLDFCNMQIRLTCELSNDVADEVWTTEVPATKDNPREGYGIYENVKIHLINPKQDIAGHEKEFFNSGKYNLFLRRTEFSLFCMRWFAACIDYGLLSDKDCIRIIEWSSCYKTNFSLYYNDLLKQKDVLGYFDSLAINDLFLEDPESGEHSIHWDFSEVSVIPEVSWMLADYLNNGNTLWKDYLTSYVRNVVRETKFKLNMLPFAHKFIKLPINLSENIRLDQIDFKDEHAWMYFHNVLNEDFKTNVVFIQRLLERYRKVDENR